MKTFPLIDGIPVFAVIVEEACPSSVSFYCPKCKRLNRHGKTRDVFGSGDGHRSSHCPCWKDGYYIKEA